MVIWPFTFFYLAPLQIVECLITSISHFLNFRNSHGFALVEFQRQGIVRHVVNSNPRHIRRQHIILGMEQVETQVVIVEQIFQITKKTWKNASLFIVKMLP